MQVLTEHPELKTICDEHEDDLEDTVEFYRKVGGVQYVLPHPNCAPDEMLRCEWKTTILHSCRFKHKGALQKG